MRHNPSQLKTVEGLSLLRKFAAHSATKKSGWLSSAPLLTLLGVTAASSFFSGANSANADPQKSETTKNAKIIPPGNASSMKTGGADTQSVLISQGLLGRSTQIRQGEILIAGNMLSVDAAAGKIKIIAKGFQNSSGAVATIDAKEKIITLQRDAKIYYYGAPRHRNPSLCNSEK